MNPCTNFGFPHQKFDIVNCKPKTITLTDLPVDIIAQCFSSLSPFKILDLSTLCKKMKIIVEKPEVWSKEVNKQIKDLPAFISMRLRFVIKAASDLDGSKKFKGNRFYEFEKKDVYKFNFINHVEMMIKLCEKNGQFFQFADESLRNNQEFVEEVVFSKNITSSSRSMALGHAGKNVRADKGFAIKACQLNGCFNYLAEEIKNDVRFKILAKLEGGEHFHDSSLVEILNGANNKFQRQLLIENVCADIRKEL